MFVEARIPQHLTGQELDAYLERGWFRLGQMIFTTNFAQVKEQLLSTIWLRVLLSEYRMDELHRKLLKQNARFITNIQPAEINEEKEVLYARYRASVSFAPSESLQHLLFGKGDADSSVYTTYEVTVREREKLIACGFFDLGGKSAEGIVSFYDPEYKKYSLGKYVIYSKIEYCQSLGLEYFYPGYFVPGNPYFDYKLKIARNALQFLQLSSGSWKRLSGFIEGDIPIRKMEDKLNHLRLLLADAGIESIIMKYEFFDAGLVPEMRDTGLLDFPIFLHLGNHTEEPVNVLIVFDVRDDQYYLLACVPMWKPDRTNPDTTFYSAYFLKPLQEIFQSPEVLTMTDLLVRIHEQAMTQK